MINREGIVMKRLVVMVALAAMLAAACGSPETSPTAAPPTPVPTPTPPAYADTLRIGVYLGGSWRIGEDWDRGWNVVMEGMGFPGLSFGRLVYSGLYRYDGREDAVPDLADGPCFVPGSDGKVIRCRLVETTFHDGTPLTADDVAYSYQVFASPVLTFGLPTEVRVVDERTVDFVLAAVDPTFLTTVLPLIPIFSRRSIEAAVAAFDEATKGLTVEGLDALAADIDVEINADPAVCSEARVAQVDAIYRKLGFPLYHEDALDESGTFDACRWLDDAALDHLDNSDHFSIGFPLTQAGIDRVAGILGVMAMGRPDIFVGTGPYRYVSQDADRVHFEAFAGYHGGVAATRYVDFVRSSFDGSDLTAGAVDIVPGAGLGPTFEAAAAANGVRVIHPPLPNLMILDFNVREGRLFSDVNLRKALQLCIDLPRDVDAARGGAAIPIYGPVMPGTWGDDPDLPKPERDVAAAKDLIEASGWKLGSDGVYVKGATRLAAQVPVRGDAADRVKMVDLIAAQAPDCGMDLRTLPLEGFWGGSTSPAGGLLQYPHLVPDTETPFDLMVFQDHPSGPDPGSGLLTMFTSDQISDAEHPDNANMGGFSDPAFDRLIEAANATYDQAERTRLYRLAQEGFASQVPAIFLWAGTGYDALRTAVATVGGPLDLTLPNWAWQPERMVVEEAAAP
jgi:ABC-type transport system substrate-binding protein